MAPRNSTLEGRALTARLRTLTNAQLAEQSVSSVPEMKALLAEVKRRALRDSNVKRASAGGKARAENLSSKERSAIARKAGKASGGWPKGKKRGPSPLRGRKAVQS